jgi:hypothetical protein
LQRDGKENCGRNSAQQNKHRKEIEGYAFDGTAVFHRGATEHLLNHQYQPIERDAQDNHTAKQYG